LSRALFMHPQCLRDRAVALRRGCRGAVPRRLTGSPPGEARGDALWQVGPRGSSAWSTAQAEPSSVAFRGCGAGRRMTRTRRPSSVGQAGGGAVRLRLARRPVHDDWGLKPRPGCWRGSVVSRSRGAGAKGWA
jgi:hypothetical protein